MSKALQTRLRNLSESRAVRKLSVTAGLMTAIAANAAVDAATKTAINDSYANMLEAIGYMIAGGVAFWGVRKLGQKMGWL